MANATEELSGLREQAAAEKGRARDAALRLEAAKAKQVDARERLVSAHDRGDDDGEIDRAGKAIKRGDSDLEMLAAEVEGLARRAQRAEQAATNFQVTDNGRLFDELEPEAVGARDELAAAFNSVFEKAAAYNTIVSRASQLVSATGKNPRQEGPQGHGLDQALHELKKALTREIPVPLPDWRHSEWLSRQAKEQARRAESEARVTA